MPTKNVSLATVKKSLPLAKALVKAVDVDKDGAVDLDEEVKRIGVRDHFVARDLVKLAGSYETYNKDMSASPSGMAAQLDTAMRSLEKADKNGDGELTNDELAKASKLAQQLVRFSQEHESHKIADFEIKPFEKAGTKAWVKLAEKEYYNVDRSGGGQPRFGTALVASRSDVAKNAKPVLAQYDALRKEFPKGTLEASCSTVNGQPVWYVHVKNDARVDVIVVDMKGKRLAQGVATPPKLKPGQSQWSLPWNFAWTEAR